MTEDRSSYRTPYTTTPGGSTPSPDVTPEEGTHELRLFTWLAIANATIIGGGGIIAWWFATHP